MAKYAFPDVLVTTTWVAEHQQDPNVRIVESDEDPLVCDGEASDNGLAKEPSRNVDVRHSSRASLDRDPVLVLAQRPTDRV